MTSKLVTCVALALVLGLAQAQPYFGFWHVDEEQCEPSALCCCGLGNAELAATGVDGYLLAVRSSMEIAATACQGAEYIILPFTWQSDTQAVSGVYVEALSSTINFTMEFDWAADIPTATVATTLFPECITYLEYIEADAEGDCEDGVVNGFETQPDCAPMVGDNTLCEHIDDAAGSAGTCAALFHVCPETCVDCPTLENELCALEEDCRICNGACAVAGTDCVAGEVPSGAIRIAMHIEQDAATFDADVTGLVVVSAVESLYVDDLAEGQIVYISTEQETEAGAGARRRLLDETVSAVVTFDVLTVDGGIDPDAFLTQFSTDIADGGLLNVALETAGITVVTTDIESNTGGGSSSAAAVVPALSAALVGIVAFLMA